mmetsp:Transcript_8959/g.13775  ORF Transcript_8959/g.13775 Transcript_8959/m.13775 type:complete len:201 (-) Transcript_8959:474-1076(-)
MNRKKGKEKENKEKGCFRSMISQKSKCLHGCLALPPRGHMVYDAYKVFIEAACRQNKIRSAGVGSLALHATMYQYPQILEDDNTRSMMKALMISTATDLLLRDATCVIARFLAEGVVAIEDEEDVNKNSLHSQCDNFAALRLSTPQKTEFLKQITNLNDKGREGVLRFISKRIDCTCLDQKLKGPKCQIVEVHVPEDSFS